MRRTAACRRGASCGATGERGWERGRGCRAPRSAGCAAARSAQSPRATAGGTRNRPTERTSFLFYSAPRSVPRAAGAGDAGGGGGGGGFLGWRDLAVGGAVALYGRTFQIAGCDAATRRWLAEQGAPAGPDEAAPEGPYDAARRVGVGRGRRLADRPGLGRPVLGAREGGGLGFGSSRWYAVRRGLLSERLEPRVIVSRSPGRLTAALCVATRTPTCDTCRARAGGAGAARPAPPARRRRGGGR